MCGIAGILHSGGRPVARGELQSMADRLAHRGPDGEGFHLDRNLGFAHRRLAILDLTEAGRQPLSNEDGTVWVTYNGQLYDFAPTRAWLESRGHEFRSRTDTEVLVHLYEEKGDELLAGIDGMFAFALWDGRRRRLLLARDRLGIKPLYYVQQGESLAFGSELKALLALPWVSRDIDPDAILHYLYQSTVPGHLSAIAGVRKLGPGQYLVVENGSVVTRTYWSVPTEPEADPEPFDEAAERLGALLENATRSHLVADVPVGTFLSGGLDSTAVTRSAKSITGTPPHTFSVRFAEDSRHDEGPAAAEVASALGTTHHELVLGPESVEALPEVIRHADEPFAIASALAVYHLARFSRQWVKVVLTGDGADEILAGYPWRHEPELGASASARSFLQGLALTAVRSRRGALAGPPGLLAEIDGRLRRTFRHPDQRYLEIVQAFIPEEMDALLAPDRREAGKRAWFSDPILKHHAASPMADEINRRLWVDLQTTLVDEMLTKVDRMTMAAGLEARVPFLDRSLVEWAFRQPGSYKVRGGRGKLLLRRWLRDRLPAAAGRAKHGFNAPLGRWLRGPLRETLRDTLSPEAVRRRGFFRAETVERLVSAHLGGRGDHSRKLFNLLVLEMWLSQASPQTVGAEPADRPLAAETLAGGVR
jgi:asparagine synthase (glutamine-hydrolysing)